MISLDSRDSRPVGRQVRDGLEKLILAGAYAPGERLPAAAILASRLAVNPVAVRGAYQSLVDDGLLEFKATGGPQVTGKAQTGRRERLLKTWEDTTVSLLVLGLTPGELQARLKEVSK